MRDVDVLSAWDLIDEGATLLDVRQNEEFELGHAPMATLIPLAELPDHLDELPRGATIACICRSGGRSARAAQFLDDAGFDVVNVTGGMLAWAQADLPLESDEGDPLVE